MEVPLPGPEDAEASPAMVAQGVGPERVADSMNPGRMGGQLLWPSNEGRAQGAPDELGRINKPCSCCRAC
eukprot:11168224-Lingulodinium_polyedra.AAC.1